MNEQLIFRLDQFEGPLELLLTLIQKNKMSIRDIQISIICDQYMEMLRDAESMNLDIACEFIVMASELMLIKSKMLLPHEEGTENDPRREIANALELYQQAKENATKLRPLYDEYSQRFIKGTDDVPPEKGLPLNLDPSLMLKALSAVLRRMRIAEQERKPQDLVNPLIKHKIVSVEEKIKEIIVILEGTDEATLYELLKDADSRSELVARFMGVLELIKIRRILITTVHFIEDVAEYDEKGLEMKFKLNPDYVPVEGESSEFDSDDNTDTEKKDDTNNE